MEVERILSSIIFGLLVFIIFLIREIKRLEKIDKALKKMDEDNRKKEKR